ELVKPPPLRLRRHARRSDRPDGPDGPDGIAGRAGQQGGEEGAAPRAGRGELSPEEAEGLLQEAQGKYVNGDFAGAMRLAQRVTAAGQASATRAWRIIGASACNTPDLKMIHAAYQHIDISSRQYVLYVCQRAGVAYSGGQFRLPDSESNSGG